MKNDDAFFYRKPDGEYILPVLDVDALASLAVEKARGTDEGMAAYILGFLMLRSWFGLQWVKRHIVAEPTGGFLSPREGYEIVRHRVTDLGELILNLQCVSGIEAPMDQVAGGQIESGYAELSIGKILMGRLPFRYVRPSGISGEDYDMLIRFPNGIDVCSDTKCKIENMPFNAKGFLRSLNEARRRNLPKGGPGAVFIQFPADWARDQNTFTAMESEIWRFLRATTRIVYVQAYTSVVHAEDNITYDHQQGWEYVNPKHDYNTGIDWRAIASNRGKIQKAASWIRLVDIVTKNI